MKITIVNEFNDDDFKRMFDDDVIKYFNDDIAELLDGATWTIERPNIEGESEDADVLSAWPCGI